MKPIKAYILLLVLFYLQIYQIAAQPIISDTIHPQSPSPPIKKRSLSALSKVTALNLGVWAIDQFISKSDLAYIDHQTIYTNIKKGPIWDSDLFGTNLLLHPIHGALYFNAARSSGYSFYSSIPFTLAGSLMWEYLFERERPSINDLISTTIGGVALGEATHRIFNQILNSSKDKTPINVTVSTGYQIVKPRMTSDYLPYIQFSVDLEYNPFSDQCKKPYDWFELTTQINIRPKEIYIHKFHLSGLLWSQTIKESSHTTLDWGIYQHFDYQDSPLKVYQQTPYRIAQVAAIGPGIHYQKSLDTKCQLDSKVFLTAVGLGASLSDFYWVVDRDYTGQPHQIPSNLLRYSTSKAAWYLLLLLLSLSL